MNTSESNSMINCHEIRIDQEYCCNYDLNVYKSPACDSLVTQVKTARHLRFLEVPVVSEAPAFRICLCDDDYPGWLAASDVPYLTAAAPPYCAQSWTEEAIQAALPEVIRFTYAAMVQPNVYLWGGTVGPNYDCSGLIQAAFASVGVVLPRDSYQQEVFVSPIEMADLQPGDLIFFGPRNRITHVALYLGAGNYIHSSGKEQGRNGIGIDSITDLTDPVSQTYFNQLQGAGRVTRSYHASGKPIQCR